MIHPREEFILLPPLGRTQHLKESGQHSELKLLYIPLTFIGDSICIQLKDMNINPPPPPPTN